MLSPAARSWLRHGVKSNGQPISPQYEAVLRTVARSAVTRALSDMVTILLSDDVELREHLEGELDQFLKIRPNLRPGEPAPRTEKPLKDFEEEE